VLDITDVGTFGVEPWLSSSQFREELCGSLSLLSFSVITCVRTSPFPGKHPDGHAEHFRLSFSAKESSSLFFLWTSMGSSFLLLVLPPLGRLSVPVLLFDFRTGCKNVEDVVLD